MKDFFFFTKGERNGLCLLLALVGASIAISANISHFIPTPKEETSLFEQELERFKNSLQEIPQKCNREQHSQKIAHAHPSGKEQENVSPKKEFKTQEVAPISIEINTADSIEFKKLKGIGSSYAARIVKFREKLGGFYSVEQIKEVYGVSEELFLSIQPHLKVNTQKIKKIDINDDSFSFGFYHPYFPKKGVSTLVKRRKQAGRIEKDSVKSILNLNDTDWERLSHYLKD